jgi:hypothetical protein
MPSIFFVKDLDVRRLSLNKLGIDKWCIVWYNGIVKR